MNYKTLLFHKDKKYPNEGITDEDFILLTKLVSDPIYLDFLKHTNGGFFYQNSLQLYSINKLPDFNSFFKVNDIMKAEFSKILSDEIFFAQEIFGNQFAFSSQGIVFLNIETGEKKIIGKTFSEWLNEIYSDTDYYSGQNIVEAWNQVNEKLNYEQRLCPKTPFVIGGDYKIENLYPQSFPEYLSANANIANQIYDLPDGTPIKLKIVD